MAVVRSKARVRSLLEGPLESKGDPWNPDKGTLFLRNPLHALHQQRTCDGKCPACANHTYASRLCMDLLSLAPAVANILPCQSRPPSIHPPGSKKLLGQNPELGYLSERILIRTQDDKKTRNQLPHLTHVGCRIDRLQ